MTDITSAELVARFPEFNESDVANYINGINAAWPCIYGGEYGVTSCQDEIILNLAAHLYAIDSGRGSSSSPVNSVASKSVGDESTSYNYADMSSKELFFSTTRYGQRYWLLISFRSGAVFV